MSSNSESDIYDSFFRDKQANFDSDRNYNEETNNHQEKNNIIPKLPKSSAENEMSKYLPAKKQQSSISIEKSYPESDFLEHNDPSIPPPPKNESEPESENSEDKVSSIDTALKGKSKSKSENREDKNSSIDSAHIEESKSESEKRDNIASSIAPAPIEETKLERENIENNVSLIDHSQTEESISKSEIYDPDYKDNQANFDSDKILQNYRGDTYDQQEKKNLEPILPKTSAENGMSMYLPVKKRQSSGFIGESFSESENLEHEGPSIPLPPKEESESESKNSEDKPPLINPDPKGESKPENEISSNGSAHVGEFDSEECSEEKDHIAEHDPKEENKSESENIENNVSSIGHSQTEESISKSEIYDPDYKDNQANFDPNRNYKGDTNNHPEKNNIEPKLPKSNTENGLSMYLPAKKRQSSGFIGEFFSESENLEHEGPSIPPPPKNESEPESENSEDKISSINTALKGKSKSKSENREDKNSSIDSAHIEESKSESENRENIASSIAPAPIEETKSESENSENKVSSIDHSQTEEPISESEIYDPDYIDSQANFDPNKNYKGDTNNHPEKNNIEPKLPKSNTENGLSMYLPAKKRQSSGFIGESFSESENLEHEGPSIPLPPKEESESESENSDDKPPLINPDLKEEPKPKPENENPPDGSAHVGEFDSEEYSDDKDHIAEPDPKEENKSESENIENNVSSIDHSQTEESISKSEIYGPDYKYDQANFDSDKILQNYGGETYDQRGKINFEPILPKSSDKNGISMYFQLKKEQSSGSLKVSLSESEILEHEGPSISPPLKHKVPSITTSKEKSKSKSKHPENKGPSITTQKEESKSKSENPENKGPLNTNQIEESKSKNKNLQHKVPSNTPPKEEFESKSKFPENKGPSITHPNEEFKSKSENPENKAHFIKPVLKNVSLRENIESYLETDNEVEQLNLNLPDSKPNADPELAIKDVNKPLEEQKLIKKKTKISSIVPQQLPKIENKSLASTQHYKYSPINNEEAKDSQQFQTRTDTIGTIYNSSTEPISNFMDLRDSCYRNTFIGSFETFKYRITWLQRCFSSKNSLFRLRRLKTMDINNDKTELISFILSKIASISQEQMQRRSIVDLYMVCSLLEVNSIYRKLLRLTDIFETVSKINDQVIETFNNGDLNNLAERFFDKSRKFIYENLLENDFTDYSQFPRVLK